jgi:DNA-binding transcriptional ArsR family regulator
MMNPRKKNGLIFELKLVTIAPIMSALKDIPGPGSSLFGKTRRAVLSALYTHPDESFYLREIVRATNAGMGAVQREVKQLLEAGIIQREVRGNQVYYRADKNCPIFKELKNMMIKTAGIGDVLKAGLQELSDRIAVAFVYGSAADGSIQRDSDIDIMIIGNVTFGDVTSALGPAQDILSREINPSVYSLEEFREKVAAGHHFLKSVLASDKFFLIGEADELEKLAKSGVAE